MRRTLALAAFIVAALAVAGCGYFQREPEPYRTPTYYGPPEAAAGAGPLDPGRQLYQRDCAFCHGDDGKGSGRGPDITGGTNGPALTDFMLRTGRMPVEAPVEQTSPDKPVYNDGEIAAIVSYVSRQFNQSGPPILDVDPRRGDLAEGQQLYQEYCGACHATTGIGGAMLLQSGKQVRGKTKGIVIPGFEKTPAQAFAEAVRTGPGSMPVFGERAITDAQLDSLVRYLVYLQDPRDEGGAPIGRVGPVMEGAVGWLVGLGALVLFIRWIGTKAGEQP